VSVELKQEAAGRFTVYRNGIVIGRICGDLRVWVLESPEGKQITVLTSREDAVHFFEHYTPKAGANH
jgi:hypothetical protein